MKRFVLPLLMVLAVGSYAYTQVQIIPSSSIDGSGTAANPILFADGTAGAPGIAFSAEPATGFARPGAGIIGLNSLAAERLRFDISNGYLVLASGGKVRWTSGASNGSQDTDISRSAAGIVAATLIGANGADATLVTNGALTRQRDSYTITPATGGATNCSAGFNTAGLTADCTVFTLAAGQMLTNIYADVTVGFTCSGTCTGTKVVQCGTAAGGVQIFAAGLNVAATGQFGLADADLGSGLTRAAAIQGGLIGSWTATTPISCRFTSGTGNWGSGAATFVNAGSIKFIIVTEQMK